MRLHHPGSTVRLTADGDIGIVRLRIADDSLRADERFPLAQRLLGLQGASATARGDGVLEVHLPTLDTRPHRG